MSPGHRELPLPPLEDGTTEATLTEWLVSTGDRIIIDRPVCTVAGAGGQAEITSPLAGLVVSLDAVVGDSIEVGDRLLTVADDTGAATTTSADDGTESDEDDEAEDEEPARPAHSPLVRRLAEEFGVDLDRVTGTGRDGRVTRDDVFRTAFPDQPLPGQAPASPAAPAEPRADEPQSPDGAEADEAPPTDEAEGSAGDGARPTDRAEADEAPTAEEDGAGEAPATDGTEPTAVTADEAGDEPPSHAAPVEPESDRAADDRDRSGTLGVLTVTHQVEVDRLLRAHEQIGAHNGRPVSLAALLIKLALPALHEFVELSLTVDPGPVPAERRDVAILVAGDDGLHPGVVEAVDQLSLFEIDRRLDTIGRGEEPATTAPVVIMEASALGASAISLPLPAGTTAAITYGAPVPTVRLVDGVPATSQVMTVTATFDPAVIDAVRANRFVARIGEYLTDPILGFVQPGIRPE